MNPSDAISVWDDRPLGGDLIGLAWPEPGEPGGTLLAAAGDRTVSVPGPRLADFLAAHPAADFVTDLTHSALDVTAGAVNGAVVGNRLYDIALLSELVQMAMPGVVARAPERPTDSGWADYTRRLRLEAAALLGRARAAMDRVPANAAGRRIFGPLGIGLDVRGALAAARGVEGVRLIESEKPRVMSVLAERERVARDTLQDVPKAKSFASTPAGAGFFARGDLGNGGQALDAFARGIIRGVRMRDQLPVPHPTDLAHLPNWKLLAPHHRAVAAAAELRTVHELRTRLEQNRVLKPRVVGFPELRALDPDIGYVRRRTDGRRGVFAPIGNGETFVVVRFPDLELRTLAACLPGAPGGLREAVCSSGPSIRLRVAQAISGLGPDEFLARTQDRFGEAEFGHWNRLAASALRYLPRGVSRRTLETWLLRYETGVAPSARQTAEAWKAIHELDPALAEYCEGDPAAVISANMGIAPEVLIQSLSAVAAESGLPAEQHQLFGIIDVLLQGQKSELPEKASQRLFASFTSDRFFPDNRLATRSYATGSALVHAMLAREYCTPTGRVYGEALPLQAVGRSHIELADAVRAATFYALVAGGFRVAAFDDEEFAGLVPVGSDLEAARQKAKAVVQEALAGWAGEVGHSVRVDIDPVW